MLGGIILICVCVCITSVVITCAINKYINFKKERLERQVRNFREGWEHAIDDAEYYKQDREYWRGVVKLEIANTTMDKLMDAWEGTLFENQRRKRRGVWRQLI